jgi:hypothetical protein
MAGKANTQKDLPPSYLGESRSFARAFGRFWGAVICVVVIGYAALLMIGRTEGFRDIISDRMEASLGVPLEIAVSRITPTLAIQLEEVKGGISATNDTPMLEAKKVFMRFRPGGFLRGEAWPLREMEIQDATFRFTAIGKSEWQPLPALAGELHRWVVVAGRSVEARDAAFPGLVWFRENGVNLRLDASDFVWRDQDGVVSAWMEEVHLEAKAMRPFEETILWSRLRAGQIGSAWNDTVDGLEVDWISSPDREIVLKAEIGQKPR